MGTKKGDGGGPLWVDAPAFRLVAQLGSCRGHAAFTYGLAEIFR